VAAAKSAWSLATPSTVAAGPEQQPAAPAAGHRVGGGDLVGEEALASPRLRPVRMSVRRAAVAAAARPSLAAVRFVPAGVDVAAPLPWRCAQSAESAPRDANCHFFFFFFFFFFTPASAVSPGLWGARTLRAMRASVAPSGSSWFTQIARYSHNSRNRPVAPKRLPCRSAGCALLGHRQNRRSAPCRPATAGSWEATTLTLRVHLHHHPADPRPPSGPRGPGGLPAFVVRRPRSECPSSDAGADHRPR